MGKLREQMQIEMELRNYSLKTIQAYLAHMTAFTKLFGKSPADLGEAEIRKYLHHLRAEKKTSWSNVNIAYCALKFFYTNILRREWNLDQLPRPREQKKLPVVLSPSEVKRILDAPSNLKHRVMLMTTYSAGLRVTETAHLKVTDIDSQRRSKARPLTGMQIRVDQGKGNKDRYTLLSKVLLDNLRNYRSAARLLTGWRTDRPTTWLFPGSRSATPVTTSTIQRVFIAAKKNRHLKARHGSHAAP